MESKAKEVCRDNPLWLSLAEQDIGQARRPDNPRRVIRLRPPNPHPEQAAQVKRD